MYRKAPEGVLKHYDFVILDLVCLQISLFLSYAFSFSSLDLYGSALYRNVALFLIPGDLVILYWFRTLKNVLKRGDYQEFLITIKHDVIVILFLVLYLFLTRRSQSFSRLVLCLTGVMYVALSYSIRVFWKHYLKKRMSVSAKRSLLVVTTERDAPIVIENIQEHNYEGFWIAGLVVVEKDMTGQTIEGIPVVASAETAPDYLCREWVDEVFIITFQKGGYSQKMVDRFLETGVTVHLNLERMAGSVRDKQFVENIGNYMVLTSSLNYASARQLFVKRLMDIAGGLAGCLITGIIFLFVAPAIYLSSPGPVFFSQVRVGKNGKKFKLYKFRSMYLDAEERKKELLKQNQVSNGMMFKMDFDPRVIGNKILPDGRKKTGIGQFIRATSLDEFPQFFNVLKGDMSLVGTRPPTLDEWNRYELHHRARLAIKPGLTGMWQVSGRSSITDFEEVVKLDTKYIREWSIGLDVKILLKTILAVVRRDGAK